MDTLLIEVVGYAFCTFKNQIVLTKMKIIQN